MPERPITDAQRIAMEDQAMIRANEQLKDRVSPDAAYIAKCAREDAREAAPRGNREYTRHPFQGCAPGAGTVPGGGWS